MIGPTAILGGAIGGLLLLAGAYVGGRIDGQKIALAAEAKADRAAEAQRVEDQADIDASQRTAAAKETVRQSDVREIRSEITKIVDRPVYRDVCVDDDGVRLLQSSASIGNGAGVAASAGAAAATPVTTIDGER